MIVAPVSNGNLLTIDAVPTFTSSRSLEIGVTVTAEDVAQSTVAPVARHGRRWHVTFTAQSGDLPSLLVHSAAAATGVPPRTRAPSARDV